MFSTIIDDLGYQQKCEHVFRSVVLYGTMTIVEDLKEKMHGIDILLNHLEDSPDYMQKKYLQKEGAYEKVCVLKLKIEDLTAKTHVEVTD